MTTDRHGHNSSCYGVLAAVSLALFAVAGTTLWWMLHAWRNPEALAATGFRRRNAGRPTAFSLLLPARHEQHVLDRDAVKAIPAILASVGLQVNRIRPN